MERINTSEFRKNLKHYVDKAYGEGVPVIVSGEKGRSVVVLSLENYNHLKSNNMENSNQKNWYDDYLINENINEAVKALIGTYSRLKTNNPDHPDKKTWNDEKNKWVEFKHNLPGLVLRSEQEATDLKLNLQTELTKVYKIENTLLYDKRSRNLVSA